MRKRILSLLLTVLMVISLFSAFSLNVNAANIAFVYNPSVYIGGGDYYNIVWKNNVAGIGYVSYRYNGKNYTVYDEENGVVRSDDYIHTVRIPTAHLDKAGSYTVGAAEVLSRDGYNITTGTKATVDCTFTGYRGQKNIKFGFASDTHLKPNDANSKSNIQSVAQGMNQFMGGVDVVVLNGDIGNNMPDEGYFDCILELAYESSQGKVPVLYVKGNHECRGEFAQRMYKYLVFDTNEFYCQFNYGPISAIVADIGEDKDDDHLEYGGLNDMKNYQHEQYEWISNLDGFAEDSEYKVLISHAPNLVTHYYKDEIVGAANNFNADIVICGHTHSSKIVASGKGGNPFNAPLVHDGGHDSYKLHRTTLFEFKEGKINVTAFNSTGTVKYESSFSASGAKGSSAPSSVKEEVVEEAVVEQTEKDVDIIEAETEEAVTLPTAAGMSTMSIKGASGSETTEIVTSPVVFDGGQHFNVVWQTTPGIDAAGYVTIGNSKKYVDSVNGKLRVSPTHSVKIPKDVLSGSSYTISSCVVTNYNMYGYKRENDKTSYGPMVYGKTVKFDGLPTKSQKKYTILALTNTLGDKAAGQRRRSSYTTLPDFVVTLGNMVKSLNTDADFKTYLDTLATVTDNGAIPVVFLRGDGESTGNYAANLSYFIRNNTPEFVMGKFYNNFAFGDVSVIGFDTATTKADTDSSYNGYANFQPIREEQVDWVIDTIPNSFKGKYNLAFANASDLTNVLGVDYTAALEDAAVSLVVTGQSGVTKFDDSKDYAVASVGSISGDKSEGLIITCTNDQITLEKMSSTSREKIGVVDVAASGGATNTPSTPNDPTDEPEEEEDTPTNDDNKDDTTTNSGSTNGSGNQSGSTGSTGNTKIETETVKGEFNGIETDYYIREVPEGWYNSYTSVGTFPNVDKVASDGKLTESVFVHMFARLAAVNLAKYTESTVAAKASAWVQECGIYNGYLNTETAVTDSVIEAVITGLFTVA